MRGFSARGYFIPGRDGAGAGGLGIVPCRRRATGVRGVGGFLRFCGFIVFLLAVSQTRDLEASLAPRGGKVGIAHLSG